MYLNDDNQYKTDAIDVKDIDNSYEERLLKLECVICIITCIIHIIIVLFASGIILNFNENTNDYLELTIGFIIKDSLVISIIAVIIIAIIFKIESFILDKAFNYIYNKKTKAEY